MAQSYVNASIKNYHMKDYSKSKPSLTPVLDCSLGVNPEPVPPQVFRALSLINEDIIKHYPHEEEVLDEIARYYHRKSPDLGWLDRSYMYLGDGSTDILHCLNVLCLSKGAKVLGHAPQFTAYVDQVSCLGAHYEYYQMAEADNYLFKADDYISRMNSSHDLFIVENPNNPTGQILNRASIQQIAEKALSYHKILIVDEAYGDYMALDNSAIHLIPRYPNIVVTRTFSKGFGLAGLRLGYMITSPEIMSDTLEQFKKVENQFNSNGIARVLGIAFLQSGGNIPDLKQVADTKNAALSSLKKLSVAVTAPTTPIMTLYYKTKDARFDLQKFLDEKARLWTVSCATYDGLDKRAVRLMLPKNADKEKLVQLLREAEAALPPP